MYKKAYLVLVDKMFYKNRIFQLKNPDNFSDRLFKERTYPYFLLQQEFKKLGIVLDTYDYFKEGDSSYVLVFVDVPVNLEYFLKKHKNADKFLIIYESPIISLRNLDKKNHKHFKKVFTWQNSLIDNKKYFKLNYANTIPDNLGFSSSDKKKLCTMISGHKFKTNPAELYTERVKAIRWFEKNATEDFDFYGKGWDRYYFKDNFTKLNRLTFLTKFLKPHYPSYKGPVKLRDEIYKKFKFAICYENSTGCDGYISEKIFDCFFSGCVPIYWGESNIDKYIPKNTFIDKRLFKTYEELYSHIKNMPSEKYEEYLENIKKFIKSEKMYPFTAECFAETISREITKE